MFNTSSFVLCSVQLIVSILLYIQILYYNYSFIITALTATAQPGYSYFCQGISHDKLWCSAATSQFTQCILSELAMRIDGYKSILPNGLLIWLEGKTLINQHF